MGNVMRLAMGLALVLSICLISAKNAYAYIDPGAGSIAFQVIIATIVAGFFYIKVSLKKIRNFFAKVFPAKKRNDPEKDG